MDSISTQTVEPLVSIISSYSFVNQVLVQSAEAIRIKEGKDEIFIYSIATAYAHQQDSNLI